MQKLRDALGLPDLRIARQTIFTIDRKEWDSDLALATGRGFRGQVTTSRFYRLVNFRIEDTHSVKGSSPTVVDSGVSDSQDAGGVQMRIALCSFQRPAEDQPE